MRRAAATITLLAALAPCACAPELDAPSTILAAPTVIAVVPEPAEGRPSRAARYRAVIAGPEGEVTSPPPLRWALCATPRPLGEEGPVAPACLDDARDDARLALAGSEPVVTATLPADVCRRFGPDPPPGDFRAQDPDATGGYYQPVLVRGLDPDVVLTHRVRCGLARAPADIGRAFERDYRDNTAPTIVSLTVDGDRARLQLGPPEDYVVLPPGAAALETRREALTVTWWASAGAITDARAIATSAIVETSWTAPAGATLWAVVRDERGGIGVASATR